jgi:general stress protein YciG
MKEVKEYLQKIGKRGGQKTASLHGKKHFADAGKKGAAKRWKQQRKKDTAQEEP